MRKFRKYFVKVIFIFIGVFALVFLMSKYLPDIVYSSSMDDVESVEEDNNNKSSLVNNPDNEVISTSIDSTTYSINNTFDGYDFSDFTWVVHIVSLTNNLDGSDNLYNAYFYNNGVLDYTVESSTFFYMESDVEEYGMINSSNDTSTRLLYFGSVDGTAPCYAPIMTDYNEFDQYFDLYAAGTYTIAGTLQNSTNILKFRCTANIWNIMFNLSNNSDVEIFCNYGDVNYTPVGGIEVVGVYDEIEFNNVSGSLMIGYSKTFYAYRLALLNCFNGINFYDIEANEETSLQLYKASVNMNRNVSLYNLYLSDASMLVLDYVSVNITNAILESTTLATFIDYQLNSSGVVNNVDISASADVAAFILVRTNDVTIKNLLIDEDDEYLPLFNLQRDAISEYLRCWETKISLGYTCSSTYQLFQVDGYNDDGSLCTYVKARKISDVTTTPSLYEVDMPSSIPYGTKSYTFEFDVFTSPVKAYSENVELTYYGYEENSHYYVTVYGFDSLNAGKYFYLNFYTTPNESYSSFQITNRMYISKCTPTISIDDIDSVTYYNGLTLGDIEFTATATDVNDATVAGTFAWEVPTTSLNAGTYEEYKIVFTPTDTANFCTNSEITTFTVNKLQLAVPSISCTEYTYNGTEQEVRYSHLHSIYIDVTGNPTTVKDAGEYIATYSLIDTNNTLWSIDQSTENKSGKITVNPKTIGLSWGKTTFEYDGSPHCPTATATDLIEGDVCTVAVIGAQIEVGTYTAIATSVSNSNYCLPDDKDIEFEITPAPEPEYSIYNTWDGNDFRYFNYHIIHLTGSNDSYNIYYYTTTTSDVELIESYTNINSFLMSSYYNEMISGLNYSVTIYLGDVDGSTPFIYDGTLDLNCGGYVDIYGFTQGGCDFYFDGSGVNINVCLSDNPNYAGYDSSIKISAYENYEIIISGYYDNLYVDCNGLLNFEELNCNYLYVVNDDQDSNDTCFNYICNINGTTQSVICVGEITFESDFYANNLSITYTNSFTIHSSVFEVESLSITGECKNFIYQDDGTAILNINNLTLGDSAILAVCTPYLNTTITFNSSRTYFLISASETLVDSLYRTVKLSDDNYYLCAKNPGYCLYAVLKSSTSGAATATFSSTTHYVVYGTSSYSFKTTDFISGITYKASIDDSNLTISTSVSSSILTITVSGLTSAKDSDMVITYWSIPTESYYMYEGTLLLSFTKNTPTISVKPTLIDTIYSSNKTLADYEIEVGTAINSISGATVSGTFSIVNSTQIVTVGENTVTWMFTPNSTWSNSMHEIVTFDTKIEFTKLDLNLVITVKSADAHAYDGKIHYTYGYDITSNIGDPSDVIDINEDDVVYYVSKDGGTFIADGLSSNVGKYEIKITGLVITSSDYNIGIEYYNGTYEIANAEITNIDYTADEYKTYDGTPLERRITATTVNNQTLSIVYYIDGVQTSTPSRINAGTTTVSYTLSAPNHETVSGTYSIIINKKNITISITIGDQTSTYTGNLIATHGYTNVVIDNNGKVSADSAKTDASIVTLSGTPLYKYDNSTTFPQTVGEYEISLVSGSLSATADNYEITTINVINGTLIINPASITTTVTNYEGYYDGNSHSGSITVSTVNSIGYKLYLSEDNSTFNEYSTENLISYTNVNIVSNTVTAYRVYYKITADNHDDKTGSYTVLIKKKALEVQIKPYCNNITYSGNYTYEEGFDVITTTGLVSGEILNQVITYNDSTNHLYQFGENTNSLTTVCPQAIGTYIIVLSGVEASSNNYSVTISPINGSLVINALSLADSSITIPNVELVYTGSEHKPTPTVTMTINGNIVTLTSSDFDVSYSNNINANTNKLINTQISGRSMATVTITGKGNYGGINSLNFTIYTADIMTIATSLEKSTNILTVEDSTTRLTTLNDVDLSEFATSSYSFAYSSEYTTADAIYKTTNQYVYEFNLNCVSKDLNYHDGTTTIEIELLKNTVSYKEITDITKTYDRTALSVDISKYVNNYNSTHLAGLNIEYYLDGNSINANEVLNADAYTFIITFAGNEFYEAKNSNSGNIIINPKNISELIYKDENGNLISELEFTYNGQAHKPNPVITYDTYVVNTDKANEITYTYGNNINAYETPYINFTGDGLNYTGTYEVEFDILAKDINTVTIDDIPDQKYTGNVIIPTLTVKDPDINNCNLYLATDYLTEGTSIEIGDASVTVTGKNNYTGTRTEVFVIIIGDMDPTLIPDISTKSLTTTVDELLSTLDDDLAALTNSNGTLIFWNNSDGIAYPDDQIVSDRFTSIYYGVKFIPNDDSYDAVALNILINVNLNKSIIEVNDVSKVYDTYSMNLDNDDATRTNEDGSSCVDKSTDSIIIDYKYYSDVDVLNEISAPKDAGTYYVVASFRENRKYEAVSSSPKQFTIEQRDIKDVEIEFLNTYNGSINEYEYERIAIVPSFILSYGDDANISTYTSSTKNNIELTSTTNQPTITITGSGNYKNSYDFDFNIIKKDINNLQLPTITDQNYTGSAITPKVVITHNGYTLDNGQDENGTDISVVYSSNIEVGIAVITVTGKDIYYTGTAIINFTIKLTNVPDSWLAPFENLEAEVGTTLQSIQDLLVAESATTGLWKNSYGSWYFVDLDSNPVATVGAANSKGNRFTIEFRDNSNQYSPKTDTISIIVYKKTAELSFTMDNVTYNRSSVIDPTIIYNSNSYSQAGTNGDIYITYEYYQNGMKLSSNPTSAGEYKIVVTVVDNGGNYNDISVEKYFVINKAVIGSANNADVDAHITAISDQTYSNGTQLKPAVEIKHGTDTLSLNIDYKIVAYGPNNTVGQTAGEVYIIGLTNYTTEDDWHTEYFDIVANGSDNPSIFTLTIEVIDGPYIYNHGQEIIPTVKAYIDGTEIDLADYPEHQLEYTNNINAGQATVTLSLTHDSEELSASGNFTIEQFDFSNLLTINVIAYNETDEPTIVVKIGETLLTNNTDYTWSKVDADTIKITGIGNYKASQEQDYTIELTLLTFTDTCTFTLYNYDTTVKKNNWKLVENRSSYDPTTLLFIMNYSGGTYKNFIANFTNNIERIKVTDLNGNEITKGRVKNGYTITLYDYTGEVVFDQMTVLIMGDVNGDGTINNSDRLALSNHVYKVELITNTYLIYSSDINMDGRVNNKDIAAFDSLNN